MGSAERAYHADQEDEQAKQVPTDTWHHKETTITSYGTIFYKAAQRCLYDGVRDACERALRNLVTPPRAKYAFRPLKVVFKAFLPKISNYLIKYYKVIPIDGRQDTAAGAAATEKGSHTTPGRVWLMGSRISPHF